MDGELALNRGPGDMPPDVREGRGEAVDAHRVWAALLVAGGLGDLQAGRRHRRGADTGDEPRHVPSRS